MGFKERSSTDCIIWNNNRTGPAKLGDRGGHVPSTFLPSKIVCVTRLYDFNWSIKFLDVLRRLDDICLWSLQLYSFSKAKNTLGYLFFLITIRKISQKLLLKIFGNHMLEIIYLVNSVKCQIDMPFDICSCCILLVSDFSSEICM